MSLGQLFKITEIFGRARLQFDLAQQEQLLDHLPNEIAEGLLQTSLESHRVALQYDHENPDLLFNTGQILNSIAEELGGDNNHADALSLYQEALGFFQRCFGLQEKQMIDLLQLDDPQPMSTGDANKHGTEKLITEEQEIWTSVEESISPGALCDTLIEMVDTLTRICTFCYPLSSDTLSSVEHMHTHFIHEKILKYGQQSGQQAKVRSKEAWLHYTLRDSAFRNRYIGLDELETELQKVIDSIPEFLMGSPLANRSAAMLEIDIRQQFAETMRMSIVRSSGNIGSDANSVSELQRRAWLQLSKVLELLSDICKEQAAVDPPLTMSQLLLRRGDCEHARRWLGQSPSAFPIAVSSAALLLKNAVTYYRGAKGYADNERNKNLRNEAAIKEALTRAFTGEAQSLRSAMEEFGASEVQEILEEMAQAVLVAEVDKNSIEGLVGNHSQ